MIYRRFLISEWFDHWFYIQITFTLVFFKHIFLVAFEALNSEEIQIGYQKITTDRFLQKQILGFNNNCQTTNGAKAHRKNYLVTKTNPTEKIQLRRFGFPWIFRIRRRFGLPWDFLPWLGEPQRRLSFHQQKPRSWPSCKDLDASNPEWHTQEVKIDGLAQIPRLVGDRKGFENKQTKM